MGPSLARQRDTRLNKEGPTFAINMQGRLERAGEGGLEFVNKLAREVTQI